MPKKPKPTFPSELEGIISQDDWNAARETYERNAYRADALRSFLKDYADRAFAAGSQLPIYLQTALSEGLLPYIDDEMIEELRRRKKRSERLK